MDDKQKQWDPNPSGSHSLFDSPQKALIAVCGNYNGGGWTWSKSDYAGNSMLMPRLPPDPTSRLKRLATMRDGLSNTILSGEKAFDPMVHSGNSWFWDEPFFLGGSDSTARYGLAVVRDAVGND